MIELSVGILRSEPRPETEPLREWAVDTISKHARFEFDIGQRSVLLKKELPFKGPQDKELAAILEKIGADIRDTAQQANNQELNKALLLMLKKMQEEDERKK